MMLWYMLLLTLTLLSFSAILFGGFETALFDDFDDLLYSRAEGVAASINTYWQAKETGDEKSFIAMARDWVEEKRKDPDLMSVSVQILNAKGERLVASKSMPNIAALPAEDFEDILDGEDSFDTVRGEAVRGKRPKFRLYTKPIIEDGKVIYVVQVTGPIALVSVALKNLAFVLFLLLPLTILLAGIPGVLLVRVTLKPVDRMVNTLRQITAENLKLKIHIPDTKDEIKRLADTFNEMIERLDRSFSSQQRFIQDISHELKAPMKLLKEELKAAAEKGGHSEEDCRLLLAKAAKEINSFSRTIENLLVLTQYDNDQMPLEIRKVDLTGLAEEALDVMKPLAEEKDITVSFEKPETITLDADENRLKSMVMSLLDNAIKYTYRKGRVSVAVTKDNRCAHIVVSDTGIGIPKDEIDYIFDRFYQGSKVRSTDNGFGLGLSSAKSIAESHQGIITVVSDEGKGSTFTVSLPLSYPG